MTEDEMLDILYAGFADVDAWLARQGPAPDPHRVNAMIRCPVDKGIQPWNVRFFLALLLMIHECIVCRTEDKRGEPRPDDPEGTEAMALAFVKEDDVSQVWLHNAEVLYMAAKQWKSLRAGKPLVFGGTRGTPRELRWPLGRTDDCGPQCGGI